MKDRKFTVNLFLKIITKTYTSWNKNEPFQMSSALSYYALFSFPALLIIIIQTTGLFYEKAEVKNKIIKEMSAVLGTDAAKTIEVMLENAVDQEQSIIAIIIGIITLLYGATGMFIALQKSLNTIWQVKPVPKNELIKMIIDRVFSLGLILMIGFLLLTSLVFTAFITATTDWIGQHFPDSIIYIIQIVNFIVAFGFSTILFALIFKILPDVKMKWKDVWLGAFVTTILFSIGKFALGIYFGTVDLGSTFGAAGSVILILLWVSYSSLILFFGGEFTKVLAQEYGEGIEPSSYVQKIS